MLYIIRTDLTSWFQICMTLKSISSIWPLVVKKLVRVDRFWSIHLVCSEHTTYTHHSNRLGELIPNLYRMSSISTNLTPFGQKQWLNLTTYDHFNEFCHTYDTCTSIECIFRDEFKNFDFGVTWGHPGSSKGSNKVISGSKNRKYCQMHMICIWIDSEFYSDFKNEHVKVIRGHLRVKQGHSEVKNLKHPNALIYIWIDYKFCFEFNGVHLKVNWGHLRSQKNHFGVINLKTRPIHGQYTWYAYDSHPNSILILMAWISRYAYGNFDPNNVYFRSN